MATYTDINKFRGEVWGAKASDVTDGQLQWSAETAYQVINGRLASQYSVPFTSVPELIVKISDMLTKAIALRAAVLPSGPKIGKSGKSGKQGEGDFALMMLEWLRVGEMDIPGVSRLSTTAAASTTEDYEPIFDLDSAVYHYADYDYLEAVLDRRDVT